MAKRKLDDLDREVLAAMRLGYGVHYGRYKADHPNTRKAIPVKETKSLPDADEEAFCAYCGNMFLKSHGCQKYCSEECKREAAKARERKYYLRKMGEILPIACPICGISFLPVSRRQKYCCARCASQASGQKQAQKRKEARNGKQ